MNSPPRSPVLRTVGLLAFALLSACAAVPEARRVDAVSAPPVDAAWYQDRDHVTALNVDNTTILVRVGKAGSLAHLGHEHAVRAEALSGFAYWPDDPMQARVEFTIPLNELSVDRPDALAALGLEDKLSGEKKAETKSNMLASLRAEQHPVMTARIRYGGGDVDRGRFATEAEIYLNGTMNRHEIPVHWEQRNGTRRVQGQFSLLQTDYGIEPYSALNGALQVADRLDITVEMTLEQSP